MEKSWKIELLEGNDRYTASAFWLHGSETWNVVLKINGKTQTALQSDDPTKLGLQMIADAQSLLGEKREAAE